MRNFLGLGLGLFLVGACGGHAGGDLFAPPIIGLEAGVDQGAGPGGGPNGDGGGPDASGDGGHGRDGGNVPPDACPLRDGKDHDGDGFAFNDGDCNDCDPDVNPGAYDFPGNNKDDDCSGVVDDEPKLCDAALPLAGPDPFDAAKAIGLCRRADPSTRRWGVLGARYVKPDNTPETSPLSHGLLDTYGTNRPQEGASLLSLSSGTARAPNQAGYVSPSGWDKMYTSGTPAGYPKESAACPGVTTGAAHDGAGLELTIRVPTNARSISFKQNFFTYEFPTYICSTYNDFYLVMMSPPVPGLPDGNIVFDAMNNPVSVNNALLQACTPQTAGMKVFTCPLGPSILSATGYEAHAATGWLKTAAPVRKGETVKLLFTVFDSGDGVLDSAVLVDGFEWSHDTVATASTSPVP